MIEFEVTLLKGVAYVYAEYYIVHDGAYQFYRGKKVVIKFDTLSVVRVQQTVENARKP
jgi:hypothetical protein